MRSLQLEASSERKIDRCLALSPWSGIHATHSDSEIWQSSSASSKLKVLGSSKSCTQVSAWNCCTIRLDWPVLLPLGLNSNIWLMGIKFHSFFLSLCSRLCCKTIWGRTIRFNYRFLCSNSENLSARIQWDLTSLFLTPITCLRSMFIASNPLNVRRAVLNDLNMPAFVSRFTARWSCSMMLFKYFSAVIQSSQVALSGF